MTGQRAFCAASPYATRDHLGETDPMNAPLRFNEALLIADRAFQPFQCVAWAPQDGTGMLSLTVIDRTSTRLLGRTQLSSSIYSDPEKLAQVLKQSRDALSQQGFDLAPWSMPE